MTRADDCTPHYHVHVGQCQRAGYANGLKDAEEAANLLAATPCEGAALIAKPALWAALAQVWGDEPTVAEWDLAGVMASRAIEFFDAIQSRAVLGEDVVLRFRNASDAGQFIRDEIAEQYGATARAGAADPLRQAVEALDEIGRRLAERREEAWGEYIGGPGGATEALLQGRFDGLVDAQVIVRKVRADLRRVLDDNAHEAGQ